MARRTSPIALLAIILAVALVSACVGPTMAVAQEGGYATNVELTFSSLRVDNRGGALAVDYRLRAGDWNWAQSNDLDLWLAVYAPVGGNFQFLYSMPLSAYDGRVIFPDRLAYYDYPYVGLCVVAVGVNDEYEPGYGYVCDNPVRVNIYQQRDVYWTGSSVSFILGFNYGLYAYPWFAPAYGFYYPSYYYHAPPYPHHRHYRRPPVRYVPRPRINYRHERVHPRYVPRRPVPRERAPYPNRRVPTRQVPRQRVPGRQVPRQRVPEHRPPGRVQPPRINPGRQSVPHRAPGGSQNPTGSAAAHGAAGGTPAQRRPATGRAPPSRRPRDTAPERTTGAYPHSAQRAQRTAQRAS